MDYAAQQASGIAAWQRDTHHVEKSFVFRGAPARNGVDSALLVHLGANGVDDIFSGSDNFLMAFGPEADPAGLVDGLGERFEVTQTNIKKWNSRIADPGASRCAAGHTAGAFVSARPVGEVGRTHRDQ